MLASPDGNSGTPTFRALVKDDLPTLAVGDLTDGAMSAIVPWTQLGTALSSISLSGIPSAYGSILLQLIVRSTVSANTDSLQLRFNGDTGGNYSAQRNLIYHNAQLTTSEVQAAAYMTFNDVCAGSTATSGYFSIVNVWIHGYAAAGRQRMALVEGVLPISSASGNLRVLSGVGLWMNTSDAINAIAISAGGGDLAAGSGYALYGVGK